MKKKIIITIIILLTAVILGVGGYFIYAINQGPVEFEDKDADYESTLLEAPQDGSLPSDYSVEDNVAYALWTVAHTNEFYTITDGVAKASIATQNVYNKRVVKDGKAMVTMISSGMVNTAKQRYFLPDKVLLRDATSINGNTANWVTSEPECVSYKTIKKRYGWLPYQATGYIICSETYINKDEMKMTDNGDGTYTLSFDLDPDGNKAPFWYRREVATNGGSSIIPEFYDVHFEMTINSKWQILIDDIKETYKVKSMGVEAVTKTDCHEEFFYTDVEFDKDAYDYFESYAYLPVLDDENQEIEDTLDPLSVIVESLQNKDGSDTNLELAVSIDDFKLNGLVALNITDLENIKVLANIDDIYLEYSDKIYLSIGGAKIQASTKEISSLISHITGLLPKGDSSDSGAELNVSQILDDLSKATLNEDGNKISIDVTLHLLGLELPIHFDIIKENDTYKLNSASVKIEALGKNINVLIKSTNKKPIKLDHKGFMDLIKLDFIVDNIEDILNKKSLDLSIDLDYEGIKVNLEGNLSFMDGIKLDSKVTVTYKEDSLELDIYYQDDTIYLSFEGINLKITKDDLLRLIEKYTSKSIDLSLSMDMDITSILETIFSIDFDELIKELVITDNSLSLRVGLSSFTNKINEIKLELKDTSYGMDGNIEVDKIKASFKVGDLSYSVRAIDDAKYYNLQYLEGIVDDCLAVYKEGKIGFDLKLEYDSIHLTGNGILDFEDNLSAKVNLNLADDKNSISLSVTYLDDVIYLDLGNTKLKITKDDLLKIISKFTDLNTDSLKLSLDGILDVLFKIDFDKLIKEFVIEEDLVEVSLDLSDFIEKLDSIKAKITKADTLKFNLSMLDMDIDLSIYSTSDKVEVSGDYINLGYLDGFIDDCLAIYNHKKLGFDIQMSYKTLTVFGEGIIDFSDKLKANIDLTLNYDDKDFLISITYLEDTIYLSYGNIHLKLNTNDLMVLVGEYTSLDASKVKMDIPSIISLILSLDTDKLLKNIELSDTVLGLELDLSYLLESLGSLSLSIERGDKLDVSLALDDLHANIHIASTNDEVVYKDYLYYDLMELDNTLRSALELYNSGKMGLSLNAKYKGIDVLMDGIIEFKDELSILANIKLSYKDKDYDILVTYIEDTLYLSFYNVKLKITKTDLLNIISKFTKSDNSKSILDTILSIDFEKLLEEVTISSNILNVKADLSAIKDDLDTLTLALSSNTDSISLDVEFMDLILGLNVFETDAEIQITDPDSYYSLGYLNGILDDILVLVDSKKMEFNLTLKYKDITLSGNVFLNLNDGIETKGILNLSYKDLSLDMKLCYIHDVLYFEASNIKLMVSKDDLLKIIAKFSDSESDSILDKVLALDFSKVIESLVISEDDVDLKVSLEELSTTLGEIHAEITRDDALNAHITLADIILDLSIKATEEEILEPTGAYNNLGYLDGILDNVLAIVDSLKLNLALGLSYKGLDIHANAYLDFNEGIKAYVLAHISYDSKTIDLEISYIDDCIYLDFDDIHVMVLKSDLEEIIAMFMDDSNDESLIDKLLSLDFDKLIEGLEILENNVTLSLDVSELIDSLSKITLVLKKIDDNLDINVSIKDLFDVSIVAADSAYEIEKKSYEYQDLGNLKEMISILSSLIKNKGISASISLSYKDLSITGLATLTFNEEISLKADLNISYKELNKNITIYYFDTYKEYEKVLLIDFGNNHLLVPLESIMKHIDKLSLDDILEFIFSSDLGKIIVSMLITDNSLDICLDLSDYEVLKNFIEDIDDVHLRLTLEDSKIVLSSSEVLNVSIKVSGSSLVIVKPTIDYTDLSGLVDNIFTLVSWIKSDSMRLSLNGSLDIKSISISLNGYLDFILNDEKKYDISGYIHVEAMNTIHDLYIQLKGKMLYLEYGKLNIGIDLTNPKEFIENIMETLELEAVSLDISKLDGIIDSLLIDASSLSVDLSTLTDIITNLLISISYIEDDSRFDVSIASSKIDLGLSLNKILAYDVIAPTEYLDNDDILSLCRTVRRILNILKEREFNLNLDLDIFDNGAKHLNINGNVAFILDIPEGESFKLDDLSFKVSLAITEYEPNGAIKVIHRVDLTWVNDMVYIVYGNNESNLSSKIKFYSDKESILSVLASVTNVLGIKLDFLNEYLGSDISNVDFSQLTDLFTKDSKTFDVSNVLDSLIVKEDGLSLSILANILNENIPSSLKVSLDLTANDTTPLYLTLLGLYTDYVSEMEYTRIDINYISLTQDSVSISAPSSLSGFRDISDIDELVNGILTTGSNKDYAISGTVVLGLPVIKDINVPVDIRVRVLEDGSPLVYAHLNVTDLDLLVTALGLSKKNVYFYYRDGYVYIHRIDNDGTDYKLKVSYSEFFDDIMYYLLDFSLGMPKVVLNAINSSSSDNENYVIDAGTVINSYSYSNHSFTFSLNMESLTGNSNLGDMGLTLLLSNMAVSLNEDGSVNTSYALTAIKNFSFKLVKVITLSAYELALTNIEKDSEGYSWFTLIDMDDVESFISSYTYGTDMIYKKGTYIGKRSHTVTFVLNHKENEYFSGQTGASIVFPSLDVVEDNGKYYKFNGWYKDKYCNEAISITQVPESNMKLYAGWVEVSYYTLTIHSMDGDSVDSVYNGCNLDSYLDKNVYTDGFSKSYILKGYSYTDGGEEVDISIMPEADLTLYAIWEEISYKVYIDGAYYMDLSSTTDLALTHDYYLDCESVYFGFDEAYLNYNTLVVKYNKYARIIDGVGYIYLISDISSLTGYYTVTLDYDTIHFTDKLYTSVSLPIDTPFDSKYLPISIYNHMNINYWYNDTNEYHYGNINEMERVNTLLKAYYATCDYLSFGHDQSSGEDLVSVTGFSYEGSDTLTIVLPKYVYIDFNYEILRSLAIFVDGDEKYSVFTGNANIYAIYFNDGFTTIGDNSFKNCTKITNVYLSQTITSVTKDAFYMTGDNDTKNAEKVRFYQSVSHTLSLSHLIAEKKSGSYHNYGAKSNGFLGIGAYDFSNAFQTYSMDLKDIVHSII